MEIRDLGLMDYRQSLVLQKELLAQRHSGQIPDTALIVEHPAVITLGARQSANELLADKNELDRQNIEVVQVRRGGGSTAHNPGQLVCYPIINLKSISLGINEYIRTLEAIGIALLAAVGLFDGESHLRSANALTILRVIVCSRVKEKSITVGLAERGDRVSIIALGCSCANRSLREIPRQAMPGVQPSGDATPP